MPLLVDTGVQSNVLGRNTWHLLKAQGANCEQEKTGSDKIFTSFGSSEPLKIIGNFEASIKYGEKAVDAKFYAADVDEKSLLGAQTAMELDILTINEEVSETLKAVKELSYDDYLF